MYAAIGSEKPDYVCCPNSAIHTSSCTLSMQTSMGNSIVSCFEGGRVSKNFLGSRNSYDWIWSFKYWISFSTLSTTNSQTLVLASRGNFGDFKHWNKTLKNSSLISKSANWSLTYFTASHSAGFATYPTIVWVDQWALESLDRVGVARWMFQPSYV